MKQWFDETIDLMEYIDTTTEYIVLSAGEDGEGAIVLTLMRRDEFESEASQRTGAREMNVYFGRCGMLEVIVTGELVEKIEQIDGVVDVLGCFGNDKWHACTIRFIEEVITYEELEQAIRAL